jgi:regulator of protease activity HflC (stomatin/prohibitin superfamily)
MSEWAGCFCLQCIREKEVGVVEDLGQFKRLIGQGPSCILWPLQSVAGRLSLRVKQLDVICETKTKDNVFVQVGVAVQYRVVTESAYDAWYRLTNPTSQIQAYVFDVIRSTVPRLELDAAFESKDDIARAVFEQLQNVMKDYGYAIVNTLVTDLSPDNKVKASMNEINAARRLKEAASHQAEADKIRQVKGAEAEAEARYLSGLGVARQRKAIVEGLQSSVSAFSDEVEGATPRDVMDILLLTQYFDT